MVRHLNDNQKAHLLLRFQHVDHLLADALQVLNCTESPSPFGQYVPDSVPIQRKVLTDYVTRLRSIMARVLQDQDIPVPKPQISSLWSFQTTLMSARVAVDELEPKYMRGYGDLPEEAAHDMEVLQTQITEVLDRMSLFLAQSAGQELQTRLDRMGRATREVECAKLLAEVITGHGIVELRPSLDAVIERLESSRFEVAVFGRVSSGKSSLLNYILQTDALPVGVTPVTALPTRIVYGASPVARIWFAEGRPTAVKPQELRQFATEQGNPDNVKHVTRIQVELPIDRLKEGVTFVDTPGLGSLARYGEMEAMAYLPRCDLGIVLVDANSTFIHEDAFIVNALCQAGVKVMVLLAKADVLPPEERATASQYVKEQIYATVGVDLPVHAVGVKGKDAELCDRWFETVLVPCLQEHRELAKLSLRRKVGLLREAAISALRRRLDRGAATVGERGKQWSAIEPLLNEAVAGLDAAMRARPQWSGVAERILDAAAQAIAQTWRRDRVPQADGAAAIISCGSPEVSRLAAEAAEPLARLRENLAKVLEDATRAAGIRHEDHAGIPMTSGMPILDLSAHLSEVFLRRPRLVVWSKNLAFRNARRQLDDALGPRLDHLLRQYVGQISQWRLQTLAEMRQVFTAKADLCRVHCEQTSTSSDLTSVEKDLGRLQAIQGDPTT